MKRKSLSIFVLVTLLFPLILTSCFDSTSEEEKKDDIVIDDGGDEFLDSIKGKKLEESEIDRLFTMLIDKIETFENVDNIDEATAQDFSSLAESFAGVIKLDSSHMKANIGYAVARIAMLNKSSAIKEVADSLDRYINDWDTYDSLKSQNGMGLFARAYRDGGVNGLGTALFANSSKLIRTNGTVPSFPQMVTIGKIQDLVESEIIPALNGAVMAFENIERSATGSILVKHDTEDFEVDLGEIYLADAGIRLLRHSLLLVTAYNFDILAIDGQGIHKVIDDLVAIEESDTSSSNNYINETVSLSADGDTLQFYYDDGSEAERAMFLYMYDVLNYNLNRADFLTLKRANHAKMYEDIKAVPIKIKEAIKYIQNETDDQENDLLKIVDINDLDAEMFDLAEAMIDDGLSIEFASNFKSPIFLADFISKVLAGPYILNETVDGVTFNYTINFSKFYTEPVQDLRDWFPLYKKTPKLSSVYKEKSFDYVYATSFSSFTHTSYYNVDFPVSLIDSVSKNIYDEDVYYFKKPTSYNATYGNAYWSFMPVTLVDPNGVELVSELENIDDALLDATLFPHFKDYTFNGIFPDMTRARWIQLAQDLDGIL